MLFYIGILPGFFDISRLTVADITVIALSSALVPFAGNLGLGVLVGRARMLISSMQMRKRLKGNKRGQFTLRQNAAGLAQHFYGWNEVMLSRTS